jgi:hypothetical protein
MRGRGIGTARGRATIMRGVQYMTALSWHKRYELTHLLFFLITLAIVPILAHQQMVRPWCTPQFLSEIGTYMLFLARRGRGVAPPARGIRR